MADAVKHVGVIKTVKSGAGSFSEIFKHVQFDNTVGAGVGYISNATTKGQVDSKTNTITGATIDPTQVSLKMHGGKVRVPHDSLRGRMVDSSVIDTHISSQIFASIEGDFVEDLKAMAASHTGAMTHAQLIGGIDIVENFVNTQKIIVFGNPIVVNGLLGETVTGGEYLGDNKIFDKVTFIKTNALQSNDGLFVMPIEALTLLIDVDETEEGNLPVYERMFDNDTSNTAFFADVQAKLYVDTSLIYKQKDS